MQLSHTHFVSYPFNHKLLRDSLSKIRGPQTFVGMASDSDADMLPPAEDSSFEPKGPDLLVKATDSDDEPFSLCSASSKKVKARDKQQENKAKKKGSQKTGRSSATKAGMKKCTDCGKEKPLNEFKPGNAMCADPCLKVKQNIYNRSFLYSHFKTFTSPAHPAVLRTYNVRHAHPMGNLLVWCCGVFVLLFGWGGI